MTDESIDAIIRRLDVPSDPDPSFARTTFAALEPRARAARVGDANRVGRLQRDLRSVLSSAGRPWIPRRAGMAGFIVLLILATLAALAIVGAINRVQPIQNGPLVVSRMGELQVIAPDGSVRTMDLGGDVAHGVSRSPDGRLVTFWTIGHDRPHLYVVGVDGGDRRELAADRSLGWTDAIDTWSTDSRYLATEARTEDGVTRIFVVDINSGGASAVTPPGVIAENPLWSPDDHWIAFTKVSGTKRSLAVIRTDGTGMRNVSGDLADVGGPDTWSPDGAWIYFGVDSLRIYRADVARGVTQPLTGSSLLAAAPASSPDGTQIAFIVHRADQRGWDLNVAMSDGTGAHRLLEHATQDGWSPDGRYVLAEWTPTDRPGGLAVVTPDGREFRVVLPFDFACDSGPRCTDGVGWGESRP